MKKIESEQKVLTNLKCIFYQRFAVYLIEGLYRKDLIWKRIFQLSVEGRKYIKFIPYFTISLVQNNTVEIILHVLYTYMKWERNNIDVSS